MKKSSFIMVTGVLCFFFLSIFHAVASPEMARIVSELVWRADGQGDYLFKENCVRRGVKIAADGSVEYLSSPGTYELNSPYIADGLILSLTANWKFTGKVTLEVSVTGSADGYVAVTNGVSYEYDSSFGSRIKWKATLAPGSKLDEVRISYKDITGVSGNWGEPRLSGMGFRKNIFIDGSGSGELFNYQVSIKVGVPSAKDCDVALKGISAANLEDVRFTQADAQTCLPHYMESKADGDMAATFWVKIPQIPRSGLPIYIYYGGLSAEDPSNAKEAFYFFEDFSAGAPDLEAWKKYDFKQGLLEYKLKDESDIKALETADLTQEDIIAFFTADKGFEWARIRKSASPAPSVDKERTAAFSEEIPNLAYFSGIITAPDGDLVLSEGANRGEYTSANIYSPFKVRIITPEYRAVLSEGSSSALDISADSGKSFKSNCSSGKYYYASRKDFASGDSLKARLRLSRTDVDTPGSQIKESSLDFRPGVISFISPEPNEELAGGSIYNIKWSAQEYEPSYVMGLAYSLDGGKSYKVITQNALNTGKYSWKVPQVSGKRVLLKVYDILDPDVYAVSDGYFSMAAGNGPSGAGTVDPAEEDDSQAEPGLEEESGEAVELSAEAEAEESEKAEDELNIPAGKQLYELLIMPGDNTSSGAKDDKGSYQRGDVVVVMPAGHIWSESEKRGFFTAQAYLTKEEAAQLLQPKIITKGADKKGNPIQETAAKRRFHVNLNIQGMALDKNKQPQKLFKDRPMLKAEAIEDKETK